MKEETLDKTLHKVMSREYITLNGCLVKVLIGGWEFNGKRYTKICDVVKAINETINIIGESIKKSK